MALSPQDKSMASTLAADEVLKACAWSNGSAEFLYGDGCVLAFRDDMNTFVALSPSQTQKDVMCTVWALSKYQAKVLAALHWYNRFSTRPRVVRFSQAGTAPSSSTVKMTADTMAVNSAPESSFYLMKNSSFIESTKVIALIRGSDGVDQLEVGYQHTLWCMFRQVSLTLHFHRQLFTVRWPCRLPNDASVESEGVVWMEQVFPVASPPCYWSAMLAMLLDFVEVPTTKSGTSAMQDHHGDPSVMVLPLPPHAPLSSLLRFADVDVQHRASLSASKNLSCAVCQKTVLHASEDRVNLLWEMSQVPHESHAMFWCLPPFGGGSNRRWLLAAVDEDYTTITITPSSSVLEPDSGEFNILHHRLDGSEKKYLGSPELRLPTTIGKLFFPSEDVSIHPCSILRLTTEGNGSGEKKEVSTLFGECRLWAPPSSGGGRYLPSVVSCGMMILSQWGGGRASAPDVLIGTGGVRSSLETPSSPSLPPPSLSSSAPSSSPAHQKVETIATIRVSGVGNFTASSDGVVRCIFDDRTRLRLFPRPAAVNGRSPEWEVSCLFRDASSIQLAVSRCGPHHRIHPYLSMAIAFRREAEARGSLLTGTYEIPFDRTTEGCAAAPLPVTSPTSSSLTSGEEVGEERSLQYFLSRSERLIDENQMLLEANRELLLHNTQFVKQFAT